MRNVLCVGLVLLLVLGAGALAGEKVKLQVEGSTTVGPIADAFAEVFRSMYEDLDITVNKTGSSNGAAALVDGRCDVAIMSRFMKGGEFEKAVGNGVFPVAHVVAMDGVCVVVHPSNPVKELTTEQIRAIYQGKIRNWKDVGGADMEIVAISRDSASGTFETFHNFIMNKEDMAEDVEYVSTNPQAFSRIKKTRGAISYVGFGFVQPGVKALKVDNIMPTRDNILSGAYPVSRPLYMFTNGYPKLGSMTHKFCSFYLTEDGQEIVEDKGFVPVTSY